MFYETEYWQLRTNTKKNLGFMGQNDVEIKANVNHCIQVG